MRPFEGSAPLRGVGPLCAWIDEAARHIEVNEYKGTELPRLEEEVGRFDVPVDELQMTQLRN
jgi:hypothetical protein